MIFSALLISMNLAFANSDVDKERAKILYENGKQLYDDGFYKEAIAAWERCHEMQERRHAV